MRFTEANVKTYKHPDNKLNYTLWDEPLPGFGFRVQAGGNKVYYAKYRMGTKQRWLKELAPLNIEDVVGGRQETSQVVRQSKKTLDPANTKAKATAAAAQTFGSAIEGYIEQLATDQRSAAHIQPLTM